MKTFTVPCMELNEFQRVREQLQKKQTPIAVSGCIDSQKAHFIYGAAGERRIRVIVVSDELKAREIYQDYRLYDNNVMIYPAKDIIFFSADVHGNAITTE